MPQVPQRDRAPDARRRWLRLDDRLARAVGHLNPTPSSSPSKPWGSLPMLLTGARPIKCRSAQSRSGWRWAHASPGVVWVALPIGRRLLRRWAANAGVATARYGSRAVPGHAPQRPRFAAFALCASASICRAYLPNTAAVEVRRCCPRVRNEQDVCIQRAAVDVAQQPPVAINIVEAPVRYLPASLETPSWMIATRAFLSMLARSTRQFRVPGCRSERGECAGRSSARACRRHTQTRPHRRTSWE